MLKYDYLTRPAPPEGSALAGREQEEQVHGREYDGWLALVASRVRWWRGALIVAVLVACIVVAGMITR